MTDMELDAVYTALAETLGRVGEANAPLFLSTLCLSLLAQQENAAIALNLITQSEGLM
jgi:hypothetical protein